MRTCLAEKLLDLRTGIVRDASGKMNTLPGGLGSDPDFNNPPITWIKTLNECLPDKDTVEYFKAYAGYCLTGLYQGAEFYICMGHRRQRENNHIRNLVKGTWRILCWAWRRQLPRYGNMRDTRKQSQGWTVQGWPILGDLPSGAKWNEAWLKQITGGDTITARLNE